MEKYIPPLLFALLLLISLSKPVLSQPSPKHLIRLYEDNDVINFYGKQTDEAYSNGTKLEYAYLKHKAPCIVGKLIRAGEGSVDVAKKSITQIMITPRDYSKTYVQPDDYPYAGALYFTTGLHSSNPLKKYNIQTELVAGIMGPHAYAGETQTFIHGLIGNDKPMGWSNQLPTDILLNVNLAMEKMLFHSGNSFEIIAGESLYLGSMVDGASIYTTLRVGVMNPYFNGHLSQFTSSQDQKRFQLYIIVKPTLDYIGKNALLQGGMVLAIGSRKEKAQISNTKKLESQPLLASVDVGLVAVIDNFSISISQKTMTPVLRDLPAHSVGNLSLTYAW